MRDNVEAEGPEDYIRKSITVPFLDLALNEMKSRFTDLHTRTALGLQMVPSIIENNAPKLSPHPPSTESLDPPLDNSFAMAIINSTLQFCYPTNNLSE